MTTRLQLGGVLVLLPRSRIGEAEKEASLQCGSILVFWRQPRVFSAAVFLFSCRDRAWAEQKKMFAFLSVANGSDEPPKFIELSYRGRGDDSPAFALVGKGITFDR